MTATVALPERSKPAKALLRLRLPAGHAIAGATVNGERATMADAETIDLTGRSGRVIVAASVRQAP